MNNVGGQLLESNQPDRLEQISRAITLLAFTIALFALMAAPLLALQWRQLPFPGFLLNPNLVVNSRSQPDWPGRMRDIDPPEMITRLGGVPVATHTDFRATLAAQEVGQTITVFTRSPDGSIQLYPEVPLIEFPGSDFATLFWLPYLVGLAYFGIALWVFAASGNTRPGRALAFFCISVSLSAGLLFEVLTTHWTDALWTIAMSALGGAQASLALRFPVEWQPVRKQPWILAIPYFFSIILMAWGIWSLLQPDQPWLFSQPRLFIYRYLAASVLFFQVVTFLRARSSPRASQRRQARLVLFGSLTASLPILAWILAPIFNLSFQFNSVLILPGLLLFPLSVAFAILRYRLLEIDSLINRALVYGILTAVLAGVIAAAIGLSQRLFILITGERSDIAIVITTLFVVSAITPIKNRVQRWVDRQFGELPASELRKFGQEVEAHIRLTDPELLGDHLVRQAATSLGAASGALYLDTDGQLQLKHTFGQWHGAALVSVPIIHNGNRLGLIQLGRRRDGKEYRRVEVDSLASVTEQVAQILAFSHAVADFEENPG